MLARAHQESTSLRPLDAGQHHARPCLQEEEVAGTWSLVGAGSGGAMGRSVTSGCSSRSWFRFCMSIRALHHRQPGREAG